MESAFGIGGKTQTRIRHCAGILTLLAVAISGCGRYGSGNSAANVTKDAKLSSGDIATGRQLGLIPALNVPYAEPVFFDMPQPPGPDQTAMMAVAINNSGIVVGWTYDYNAGQPNWPSIFQMHPVYSDPTTSFTPGATHAIQEPTPANNYTYYGATINDLGYMASTGYSLSTWAVRTVFSTPSGGNPQQIDSFAASAMTNEVNPRLVGTQIFSGSHWHWSQYRIGVDSAPSEMPPPNPTDYGDGIASAVNILGEAGGYYMKGANLVLRPRRSARSIPEHSAGVGGSEAPVDLPARSVGGLVPKTRAVLELAEGRDPIAAHAFA